MGPIYSRLNHKRRTIELGRCFYFKTWEALSAVCCDLIVCVLWSCSTSFLTGSTVSSTIETVYLLFVSYLLSACCYLTYLVLLLMPRAVGLCLLFCCKTAKVSTVGFLKDYFILSLPSLQGVDTNVFWSLHDLTRRHAGFGIWEEGLR